MRLAVARLVADGATNREAEASLPVPRKTRSIQVKLAAKRTVPSYNDGYADNVSLTLAAP